MMVVVSYDVSTGTKEGRRRLRLVAKQCRNFGQRVQLSVFECLVTPEDWVKLRHRLVDVLDEDEDSLRFYFLGARWRSRIEHHGIRRDTDPEGILLA